MNKQKEDIDVIWDSVWSKFTPGDFTDVDKINDLWTVFHLEILKNEISALPPDSKFLEAGCGMGQWCFYANTHGHQAIGVDVAKNIIESLNAFIRGKERYRNIKFIVDDLMDSKLESNQFDFIVSLGVIEHFPDSLPMLRQLHRLLKPGGRIFISVPNLFSMQTITRPLTKLLGVWKIGYEKSYSPRGLIKEAEAVNFKVLRSAVLPSGLLFGRVLNFLPVIGRAVRKLGYFIETRQNTFGLYIYLVCGK